MRRILVRSSAQADLLEIQTYTLETWGISKTIKLQEKIDITFSLLTFSPLLGRQTNRKNTYAYTLGTLPFIIIYGLTDEYIYINKVIHTKRRR